MSTVKVNTIRNTADVEMYLAKAWVNFNGTGTVAIRAAGNVSSITDNGTGDYTVNFTSAMQDANYAAVLQSRRPSSFHPGNGLLAGGLYSTTGFQIETTNGSTTREDHDIITVAIFR